MWAPDFDVAASFVMSPPIRSAEHRAAIRAAVAGGVLTIVGTDHAGGVGGVGWGAAVGGGGRHADGPGQRSSLAPRTPYPYPLPSFLAPQRQ